MFENKMINGVHCSRYIASYIKKTGDHRFYMLRDWLKALTINGEPISYDDRWYIYNFATNGKLELEDMAKTWYNKNKE